MLLYSRFFSGCKRMKDAHGPGHGSCAKKVITKSPLTPVDSTTLLPFCLVAETDDWWEETFC